MTTTGTTLITSIPPVREGAGSGRNVDIQQALTSFVANGFQVVSLLSRDEIPDKRYAADISYMRSENAGFFHDRYGPSFADIFGKRFRQGVSAVVNADVYMLQTNILPLLSQAKKTVLLSRRVNVSRLGGSFEGVYRHGIDALFFSGDVDCEKIARSELGKFQLGAPFWDLVIPLALSFHNKMSYISPPLLLHPHHEVNWAADDYKFLREKAVESVSRYAADSAADSPQARQFIEGMKAFQASFSRRSAYRDQKRAAEYIALSIRQLESDNLCSVEVNFNDPHLRRSITGLLEMDSEAMELARKVFPYTGYPLLENNGFIDIAKILFRARKSRENAKLARGLFSKT